jgi:AmmeMemoRadiSam system protein A
MHTTDQGTVLLALARAAIERALETRPPTRGVRTNVDETAASGWLQAHGSSFVTLTQAGQLRGCIGTLEAWRPLNDDVQANAVAAALRDPRFEPLRARELPHTRVEVSLLSTPEPLEFQSEADALAQLRPGVDGIVLAHGQHRSTFLPQVWEQLPDPVDFMAHLKRKASLPAHFWAQELRLHRYSVSKWKETP